jgi:hypothetical protein
MSSWLSDELVKHSDNFKSLLYTADSMLRTLRHHQQQTSRW